MSDMYRIGALQCSVLRLLLYIIYTVGIPASPNIEVATSEDVTLNFIPISKKTKATFYFVNCDLPCTKPFNGLVNRYLDMPSRRNFGHSCVANIAMPSVKVNVFSEISLINIEYRSGPSTLP